MTVTTPRPGSSPEPGARPSRPSLWRYPLLVIVLAFAVFWIWALFFASKEALNGIGEEAWTDRAQTICETAETDREALADFREVDDRDQAMLDERAALVDRATDILERMLDDVVAVPPSGEKGADLVPMWEADYRTYLADRRVFSDNLRAGDYSAFAETVLDGIPISDKIARFAGDNFMPACAPPNDLG